MAETGVDMTRFRTGPHLVSWGGRAPQDHQSGKRAGRSKAKKGNRYLGAILGETAGRPAQPILVEGARHRRLTRRRGTAKACVATLERRSPKLYQEAAVATPGTAPPRGSRPGLLRTPAGRPPPGRPSRRQSYFGFELPSRCIPRTRPRREQPRPSRLTHTAPRRPRPALWPRVRCRTPS